MADLAHYGITDAEAIRAIEPELRRAIGGLLVAHDMLTDTLVALDRDWWDSRPEKESADSPWPEPDYLTAIRAATADIGAFIDNAKETAESAMTPVRYDPETGFDWDALRAKILKSGTGDSLSGAWAVLAEFVVVGVVMKYGPRALSMTKGIAMRAKRPIGAAVRKFGVVKTTKYAVLGPAAAAGAVVAGRTIATKARKLTLTKILAIMAAVAAIGIGGKAVGSGAASLGKGVLWLAAGFLAVVVASKSRR
jgi:hypothetical protein